MSEAAPGYRDAQEFATPQRARLTEATRHLIDAVMTAHDVDSEVLDATATQVEGLVERLTGVPAGRHPAGVRRHEATALDYLPRSPVVGETSPLAPPFEWELRDGHLYGSAVLGAPYEGPPRHVHGGMIALIFDEVLGMANIAAGVPAMTGTLTVKYRAPTPLYQRVDVEAWVDRVSGRRVMTQGTMMVGDVLTAEAEGIFVTLTPDRAQRYFGRDPDA